MPTDIRMGQKRRLVAAVLRYEPRAVVRLSCGHIAFRQYRMKVGMRAYCGICASSEGRLRDD